MNVEENETENAVNQNLKVNKLICNVVPLFRRVVICIILDGFIFYFFLMSTYSLNTFYIYLAGYPQKIPQMSSGCYCGTPEEVFNTEIQFN